jgi:glycogen phosphorylase
MSNGNGNTQLSEPAIPKSIKGLNDLSHNLWWSWHAEARDLFKYLDRFLWKSTGHNPVRLLQKIAPHQLVAAAQNQVFLEKYRTVMANFDACMSLSDPWFGTTYPNLKGNMVAYFSPEFAIHSSLPFYAGGLGILAGDYCKEASDLGLPLVGIGFMYPKGYFHQRISADGWQEETYHQLNFEESPVKRVSTVSGQPLKIEVQLPDRAVQVAVWQVNVGNVKLYLMDCNNEENCEIDRQLSSQLYLADRETRLKQEIILGIGGVRTLRALGINPTVWHSNEGHSAFMALERVRELVERGASFLEAAMQVQSTTVFTTHTPVPAGNDVFSLDLIEKYFRSYWGSLGLERDSFMKLGLDSTNGGFSMTVLGIRMSGQCNGVSQLHGGVCRRMWHPLWPDVDEESVPICHVTNGIHVPTWIAHRMDNLFSKHLGQDWMKRHDDADMWKQIEEIPDYEIWAVRRWLKSKLISCMQNRARIRWAEDHIESSQVLAMGGLFDPDVLTIGFCRRFTGYKRATLILHDIEQLKHLLLESLRPVQIIFAGKAHPNDEHGKHLIQEIYRLAKSPEFGGRLAMVENYDMHMARYLVQGVDVWLNTPRPLQEACGTSGQKAAANGVLNLSILDGWWYEGFNGANGWAIHNEIDPLLDSPTRDKEDAEDMYRLLREKIIPLYYDRALDGVPSHWVKMIKESIRSNAPQFSARRMVKEYTEELYLPAMSAGGSDAGLAPARTSRQEG